MFPRHPRRNETVAIAKVISKKRNWSAPGPDSGEFLVEARISK